MPSQTLVHIVPTVPPAFNGLADYSYKLWEHWPQPRPHWKCLAATVPPGASEVWPDAQIMLFERSQRGLLDGLERAAPDCVVLHYVGYAYHPKGVPLWLPAALREWKARSGQRLCVMFHELYALGTPRQSAFWIAPWAKKIVVQLAEIADAWVTSNEDAAARLVHSIGVDTRRGCMVPVGSNIEPATPVDFEKPWPLAHGGKLRIAVFGLAPTRLAALREHRNLLKSLCEREMVQTIALIGKAENAPAEALRALQNFIAPGNSELWREYPDLAPAQLSEVLVEHDIALARNPPQLLTKSGSYAASCVHGLLTICPAAGANGLPFSGLGEGEIPLPYLASHDENAGATLQFLRDFAAVEELRRQVRRAALGRLSWPQIVRQWKEIVAV